MELINLYLKGDVANDFKNHVYLLHCVFRLTIKRLKSGSIQEPADVTHTLMLNLLKEIYTEIL